MKPLIAIASVLKEPHPDSAFVYREYFVNEAYTTQIEKAGALPFILPYLKEEDIEEQLAPFDALLVPGGADFNPACYHEEKKDYTVTPDDLMDSYQLELIKKACSLGKWVFGICRGFQGINIVCGGTLFQDILAERPASISHMRKDCPYKPVHTVKIEKDSRLFKAFGKTELEVNSLHHQGIKTLGKNLKPIAFSEDGIIEGFEGHKILAVQWHPEALTSPFFEYIVSLLKQPDCYFQC